MKTTKTTNELARELAIAIDRREAARTRADGDFDGWSATVESLRAELRDAREANAKRFGAPTAADLETIDAAAAAEVDRILAGRVYGFPVSLVRGDGAFASAGDRITMIQYIAAGFVVPSGASPELMEADKAADREQPRSPLGKIHLRGNGCWPAGCVDLTDPDSFRSMTPAERETAAARIRDLVESLSALTWVASTFTPDGARGPAPAFDCSTDAAGADGPDWRALVRKADVAIAAAVGDQMTAETATPKPAADVVDRIPNDPLSPEYFAWSARRSIRLGDVEAAVALAARLRTEANELEARANAAVKAICGAVDAATLTSGRVGELFATACARI